MEKEQTAWGEISGKVVKEMSVIISSRSMTTKLFVFYPNKSHHCTSITIAANMEAWFVSPEPETNAYTVKSTSRLKKLYEMKDYWQTVDRGQTENG